MEHTDVCFAPVLSMAEAPEHPHNVARGTFVERNGIVQPAPGAAVLAHAGRDPAPAVVPRPAHRRGPRRLGRRRRPHRQAAARAGADRLTAGRRGDPGRAPATTSARAHADRFPAWPPWSRFHAHPDDETIATGGTMARAAADGHRVVLVVGDPRRAGRAGARRARRGRAAVASGASSRPTARPRSSASSGSSSSATSDSGMMGEPTNDNPDSLLAGRRRRGRRAAGGRSCATRTPTSSPSTTTTAATATPTTSRSTGSACGPPSWPASTGSSRRP